MGINDNIREPDLEQGLVLDMGETSSSGESQHADAGMEHFESDCGSSACETASDHDADPVKRPAAARHATYPSPRPGPSLYCGPRRREPGFANPEAVSGVPFAPAATVEAYEYNGPWEHSVRVDAIPTIRRDDYAGRCRELYQATCVTRVYEPYRTHGFRLNLAAMQQYTISRLKSKLAKEALEQRYRPGNASDTDWLAPDINYETSTMRQFVLAMQDYNYMLQVATEAREQDFDNPFSITNAPKSDFVLLKETLQSIIASSPRGDKQTDPRLRSHFNPRSDLAHLRRFASSNVDIGEEELQAWQPFEAVRKSVRLAKWVGVLIRIGAAAFMAGFVLGPMYLIELVTDLGARWPLTVATIFVGAFALLAAWRAKNPDHIMSATVAYGAVLVVFVAALKPSPA